MALNENKRIENTLNRFFKNDNKFRKPLQNILNIANKLTRRDVLKIKSEIVQILPALSFKCKKCGHQDVNLNPLTGLNRKIQIKDLKKSVAAFKDLCDQSSGHFIRLNRVSFDESSVRKPRKSKIELPSKDSKLRVRRMKIPKKEFIYDSDQLEAENSDTDEYNPGLEDPQESTDSGSLSAVESDLEEKVDTCLRYECPIEGCPIRRLRDGNSFKCHFNKRHPQFDVQEFWKKTQKKGRTFDPSTEPKLHHGRKKYQKRGRPLSGNLPEVHIQARAFMKKIDPVLKKEDYEKFFTPVIKNQTCPTCSRDFDTQSRLLYHEPCRYKGLFNEPKCPVCQEQFTQSAVESLFRHMEQKHFQSKKYKCLMCPEGKEFIRFRKMTMIRHACDVHIGSSQFSCTWPGCIKGFIYETACLKHIMFDHLKKMPFKCDICGKEFTNRVGFKGHKELHIKGKFPVKSVLYPCPLEGCPIKGCWKIEVLRHHLKSRHPGVKDVERIVQKAAEVRRRKLFYRKPEIKVDISQDGAPKIVVEEPEPLELPEESPKDDFPKVTYNSIEELNMKASEYFYRGPGPLNDPKKTYCCKMINCGKQFMEKREILTHIIAYHFRIYPYGCESCPFKAVSIKQINNHRRESHAKPEELIYPCFSRGCRERFPLVSMRKHHIKVKHKDFIWTQEYIIQHQHDLDMNRGKNRSNNHGQMGTEARKRPRKSSCPRTRKRGKQNESNESDSELPTQAVFRPNFNTNHSAVRTINQPSTSSATQSVTTVETVFEPESTDYWYQHQPFSTSYVSMPIYVQQPEIGMFESHHEFLI